MLYVICDICYMLYMLHVICHMLYIHVGSTVPKLRPAKLIVAPPQEPALHGCTHDSTGASNDMLAAAVPVLLLTVTYAACCSSHPDAPWYRRHVLLVQLAVKHATPPTAAHPGLGMERGHNKPGSHPALAHRNSAHPRPAQPQPAFRLKKCGREVTN